MYALLVETEKAELAGMIHEGTGAGECDLHGGIVVGVGISIGFGFLEADGEHIVFERTGAIETPHVVCDGLREVQFEVVGGGEVCEETLAESLVRGAIFGGENGELTGESMAHGVEADGALAGFGLWTGRFLRVGLMSSSLSYRRNRRFRRVARQRPAPIRTGY
jgi:hypothetical protein